MRKGREGRKEKRGGKARVPPLSEILNTPLSATIVCDVHLCVTRQKVTGWLTECLYYDI